MNQYDWITQEMNQAKSLTRIGLAYNALEILKTIHYKHMIRVFFEMEFKHCIQENILCEGAKNRFLTLHDASYTNNILDHHCQYSIQYAVNYSVLKTLLKFELKLDNQEIEELENEALFDAHQTQNPLIAIQEAFSLPYKKINKEDTQYYRPSGGGIY